MKILFYHYLEQTKQKSNESITKLYTNFDVSRKAKVHYQARKKQLAEKQNKSFAFIRKLYKKNVNKAINRELLDKKTKSSNNPIQQTKQDQSPSHKLSSSESEASNSFNFLAIS